MNILLVKKKSVIAWHMQCGQADFDDVITKSKIGSVSLKPENTGFCQKEKGTQLNKPIWINPWFEENGKGKHIPIFSLCWQSFMDLIFFWFL